MPLTLGEKVKRIREQRGWTKKELADQAGLHQSHIGLIEKGGRTDVRPETLDRLAMALGVEKMYLITDDLLEYIRVRIANLKEDEQARYLKMSPTERQDFILTDLQEKWGYGLTHEFYWECQSEIGYLIDPSFMRDMAQQDSVEYWEENWHEELREEAEQNSIPWPWMLCPADFRPAVYKAVEHGITGADLLKAVDFLINLRAPALAPAVPGMTPTQDKLHTYWTQVHMLEQLGLHDDLTKLDGDRNVEAISLVRQAGIKITLADFMENSTIYELASVWDRRVAGQGQVQRRKQTLGVDHDAGE